MDTTLVPRARVTLIQRTGNGRILGADQKDRSLWERDWMDTLPDKLSACAFAEQLKDWSNPAWSPLIGLLQLAIMWYKICHAGGQAHYYSRTVTLKQRDLNQ